MHIQPGTHRIWQGRFGEHKLAGDRVLERNAFRIHEDEQTLLARLLLPL
jgi:hypothetical protein